MNSYEEHERVAIQLAKELEEDGYTVTLTPTADRIPFSLEGYVPDLLAEKGDDHLLIEIKLRESAEHTNRFRKVVEIVEKNPGWRFLVKTVSPARRNGEMASSKIIPMDAIEQYLDRAESIQSSGAGALSIPYFWNAAVALLMHKAERSGLSTAGLSDRSLINYIYTMGVISSDEREELMRWNELRNSAVHLVPFEADAQVVAALSKYTKTLLNELKLDERRKGQGGTGNLLKSGAA